MPEPKDLHVDSILSNFSVQYRNEDFIWRQVSPPVMVNKRSDKYFKYAKEDSFRELGSLVHIQNGGCALLIPEAGDADEDGVLQPP